MVTSTIYKKVVKLLRGVRRVSVRQPLIAIERQPLDEILAAQDAA
jgi:hypothetical protein